MKRRAKMRAGKIAVVEQRTMILAPESPLKRLPKLNPRQGMFFDAIRLTIEMADFAMERLYANLVRMTSLGSASGGPVSFAVEPFLDAWSVVDSIHRLSGSRSASQRRKPTKAPAIAKLPKLNCERR
jgi:hypothetical protein